MLKKSLYLISLLILNLTLTSFLKLNASKSKKLPVINEIIISGNKYVSNQVILNSLPYKVGKKFDKSKTNEAINNIYSLGYFRQIKIETAKLPKPSKKINLYIILEEKKILEKFEFKGNKAVKTSQIIEKLSLEKITTVDEETLVLISKIIRRLYTEKGYHKVSIKTKLIPNEKVKNKVIALFTIKDGPKSRIIKVSFKGNKNIPDRKLRGKIFSREDWIFFFFDGAGEFKEEELEMDRHRIEYLYKNLGYLLATVAKPEVKFSKNNKDVYITFYINEGERFFVNDVKATGDELFSTKKIFEYITIEKGQPYSQSKLIESISNLKNLWGSKGYLYTDVYPQVKPDVENKLVDIIFNIERGKKLYVNRIDITGNKVTRDKVIRRQLDIEEGDVITSKKLNQSKNNVEYLSFFDRGGVNWKIHRISDDKANLELNVKEAKTGNLNAGLTYGSEQNTPRPSIKGQISAEKKNVMGQGWDTAFSIQGNRHYLQKLQAAFFDPSLFDSDISAGMNLYRRWEEYEQWKTVDKAPKETITGASIRFGVMLPKIDKKLQLLSEFGIENIKNNNPVAIGSASTLFEPIVKRSFQYGTLTWISLDLVKDTRNHQVYPSNGYKISWKNKTALPVLNEEYSFFKIELEASWYTPLIGEDSLVLALHGKGGSVHTIGGINEKKHKAKIIPYKELFHMGGQTTVRGFVWGSIGPAWFTNDPLGGRYAIQFNSELVFPLIPDYSVKGHFFYDFGAGWSTPKDDISDMSLVKRNKFNPRHSVGFGLNLLKPVPAKIDWGYKLDRDKKNGESPHEFHLSMNYAW